ncbi:MAG: Uma2 family endonuclease [Acidobacteriota bacterium]
MATQSATLQYEEPEEGQPLPPKEMLPTMHDLPDEEVGQTGMPDIFHIWQPRLLDETFDPPNYDSEELFTATDMNVYYNVHDFTQYKQPDWFAVVGLPKLEEKPEMRMSYVIWQEGVPPLVVVELLSPRTQKEDLGQVLRAANGSHTKWDVYERWLRVPYYITFSRRTDDLRIFKLHGMRYEEVIGHQGRLWIEEAELGLGLWRGAYSGEDRLWLRWYDRAGNWLLTKDERFEQERERAEQERQEKGAALHKAEKLAAKLRELGIDPDRL